MSAAPGAAHGRVWQITHGDRAHRRGARRRRVLKSPILSRTIDWRLIRAGRRVRVGVLMSDRSGSLARLTELIASRGASVIQAIPGRSGPRTLIDQTDMVLTLETRGPDHSKALIRALRNHALKTELVK